MESESEWESNYQYEPRPLFEERFRCLSMKQYKHPHPQSGDKIIMPPSSLSQIVSLPMKYPLLFKIQSCSNTDKISHCGVLEFDADEGFVHMPEWMMQNLGIEAGEDIVLSSADLPKGLHMKLQPHLTAFTNIANPRAVLEKTLRNFTCLSKGDTFLIEYNEVEYYIDVVEVMPGDAVTLIDTDCTVEFEPPLDYVEDQGSGIYEKINGEEEKVVEEGKKEFRPFTGKGRRLDGEAVVVESGGGYRAAAEAVVEGSSKVVVGERKSSDGGKEDQGKFKPFTGRSRVLGGPLF